jgi:DNA-3-methyladenine glycosylase II
LGLGANRKIGFNGIAMVSTTLDKPLTERLDSPEALAAALTALNRIDPRLGPVIKRAGAFEIRTVPPGFGGMCRIICGQQLSTASAAAIWGRFSLLPGALDPSGYLLLDEETIRKSGFSVGKYRTVRGIAEAMAAGAFDLDPVAALPSEEAVAALTALKGIGPWTAELYLMFSAGHPDIFPAGDLALQRTVEWGFGLERKPDVKWLIEQAKSWSPHRSAAALLFWRYYRAIRNREGVPL